MEDESACGEEVKEGLCRDLDGKPVSFLGDFTNVVVVQIRLVWISCRPGWCGRFRGISRECSRNSLADSRSNTSVGTECSVVQQQESRRVVRDIASLPAITIRHFIRLEPDIYFSKARYRSR